MDIPARQIIHGLVFLLGLILIVGGVAREMYGAWIVGLIVAAVNFRQMQLWNKKKHSPGEKNRH